MKRLQSRALSRLKSEAKSLLQSARNAEPLALATLTQHHPEGRRLLERPEVKLADVQVAIARREGYSSWNKLRQHHDFQFAVSLVDAGDVESLALFIGDKNDLCEYRCQKGEIYESGYFAGATLLDHIAGNPDRGPLPPNIVDIAKRLIDLGCVPSSTDHLVGLILTSRRASEAGVAMVLVHLVSKRCGGKVLVPSTDHLDLAVRNRALETAASLVQAGAVPSLRHRAVLEGEQGMTEALQSLEGQPGRQAELDAALQVAVSYRRREAVMMLLAAGANLSVIGKDGQSPLHIAVHLGDLEMVRALIEHGAAKDLRNTYGGNAIGQAVWSIVNEPSPDHEEVVRYLIESGVKVDDGLYTGVEHVDAMLDTARRQK